MSIDRQRLTDTVVGRDHRTTLLARGRLQHLHALLRVLPRQLRLPQLIGRVAQLLLQQLRLIAVDLLLLFGLSQTCVQVAIAHVQLADTPLQLLHLRLRSRLLLLHRRLLLRRQKRILIAAAERQSGQGQQPRASRCG